MNLSTRRATCPPLTRLRGLGTALVLGLGVLSLAACNRDRPLEGERLDIRAPWGQTTTGEANRSLPISLGTPTANAAWSQRQGTPGARPGHPALSAAPQLAWSTSIGEGDSRRVRLTTDPVGADGRIFTLDARARVQATSTNGEALWSVDLTPARDQRNIASGGALAVSGGRLYVSSAYAFVAALDVASGRELWRVEFDAPLTGSPAVQGDTVYVGAIDSSLWALDAASGRVRWTIPGTPTLTALARGSAPAVAGEFVVFPTTSGELTAMRRSNGGQVWTTIAVGRRTGAAAASISSLSGDPVVEGGRLYAANQSGRVYAIEAATGRTLWTATEGAFGPVWPVGGSVFLVSDENRLIRLDARDGSVIWATDLPRFTTERPRRQLGIYPQHGPVLAGGRLWVASGDGHLRGFDPASGAPVADIAIPGGAASGPIAMGGALYVLNRSGALLAYR